MKRKFCITFLLILLSIIFLPDNARAVKIQGEEKIEVGDTVTVTLDFERYIGAYDGIEVEYNDRVLQYLSGDPIKESWWVEPPDGSLGIYRKTYTFKALRDGISVIKIKIKGLVAGNQSIDELGDFELTKRIIVGKGYEKGDVDMNGIVDAVDAAKVLTLFKNQNATEEVVYLGDVDGTPGLTAVDAMTILTAFKNNSVLN